MKEMIGGMGLGPLNTHQNNHGKAVLIVDDDLQIRTILAEILTDDGHLVECACNGKEALDLLLTRPEYYHLVLLDLRMPVMDGHEFRRLQKNILSISSIPVIVMTADGQISINAILESGAGLIQKPIDLDKLLSTIRDYFQGVGALPFSTSLDPSGQQERKPL